MQRTVITPADLSGAALDDLKGWLGISRPREDTLLTNLLGASLSVCEAFIGQAPLKQIVEERIQSNAGTYSLATLPARAFVSADWIGQDNARFSLEHSEFEFEIDVDRRASITLMSDHDSPAILVSFKAGIAEEWSEMPEALKQGIIRLAAFHYRDRETGRDAVPPASVAALWRPWRIVRLT
ncbi:MAG: hypothetical protein AAGA34_03550 [Pseudomonadota bacterium]